MITELFLGARKLTADEEFMKGLYIFNMTDIRLSDHQVMILKNVDDTKLLHQKIIDDVLNIKS